MADAFPDDIVTLKFSLYQTRGELCLWMLHSMYSFEDAQTWMRTPQPILSGEVPQTMVTSTEKFDRLYDCIRNFVDGNHV